MEKIIAVVVMVAIVMGLIGLVVIPMQKESEEMGMGAVGKMSALSGGITMDQIVAKYEACLRDIQNYKGASFIVDLTPIGKKLIESKNGSAILVGDFKSQLLTAGADEYAFEITEQTFTDAGNFKTIKYTVIY